MPGHDDVRRPDRTGRSLVHRRPCARAWRELHGYRGRLHQGRFRDHARPDPARPARRLGAGHQARQPHVGQAQRRPVLAQVDAARSRGEFEAPEDRSHRHPLPAPRLQRHGSAGAAVCARCADARRQDPLLGSVEFPRVAHRRDGARRAPDRHARSGGLPAVLQPAQPHARGRDSSRVRALRHRRHVIQPGRARRAHR